MKKKNRMGVFGTEYGNGNENATATANGNANANAMADNQNERKNVAAMRTIFFFFYVISSRVAATKKVCIHMDIDKLHLILCPFPLSGITERLLSRDFMS